MIVVMSFSHCEENHGGLGYGHDPSAIVRKIMVALVMVMWCVQNITFSYIYTPRGDVPNMIKMQCLVADISHTPICNQEN